MSNTQLHSLAAYIEPTDGPRPSPLTGRVRYYTARILGDVASADYLLQMGVARDEQKRTLRNAFEATASAPGCGVCNCCNAYIGVDTPADAAVVLSDGREYCSHECPETARRATMAYLSSSARRAGAPL